MPMLKKILILVTIIFISCLFAQKIEGFFPIMWMWYSEWMRLYIQWMKAMTGNLNRRGNMPMMDPFTGLPLQMETMGMPMGMMGMMGMPMY